jgi:hypothetical protein
MPKNDAMNSTNTAAIRNFKDAFMIMTKTIEQNQM